MNAHAMWAFVVLRFAYWISQLMPTNNVHVTVMWYDINMGTGIEDVEQLCLVCGQRCVNRRSLGNHVARSHKDIGGLEGYVLRYVLRGDSPKCKCGCGDPVKWHKLLYRFNDYLTGHNRDRKGYCKIGFKSTSEQVSYRNSCIKKTYEDPSLRSKVGESVVEAFKDPEKKRHLIDGQTRSWASDDRRARHSLSQKAAWAAEHDARVARVYTPEFRDKLSKIMAQKYLDGGFEWSKGTYVSTKTGKTCYYRSSWELSYMRLLDADVTVTSWEYEFTSIEYEVDGTLRRYVPDFHVVRVTGHELVEVKPMSLRRTWVNDAKRDAARAYCASRGWTYVEWEPPDTCAPECVYCV